MGFEQALRTALSRNPMNSYERAMAYLEMIDAFPEQHETIMRVFDEKAQNQHSRDSGPEGPNSD